MRTKKEMYKTAHMDVNPKGFVSLDSYSKEEDAYWVTTIDGSHYYVWANNLSQYCL